MKRRVSKRKGKGWIVKKREGGGSKSKGGGEVVKNTGWLE